MVIAWLLAAFLVSLIAFILKLCLMVASGRSNRRSAVAFFHPYTNDGGGGERVLWCAIKATQEEIPNLDCIIYTGDQDAMPESLFDRAIDRFGVALIHPPKVVHLQKRKWIEETTYPHFTMIGQSLGSVYLSWEALSKLTPLYYFDTSGYSFTYPLARMFGCTVLCYTHYPTISSDMISRVRKQISLYNNSTLISRSTLLSHCKVIYYKIFSWMYGYAGSFATLAMVNSSWTYSHIELLWRIKSRISLVYPPCDTSILQELPLERPIHAPIIISVAQFRPEKAHMLQLEAFSLALQKLDVGHGMPKLCFVGSCRNQSDEERLQNLKKRTVDLNLNNNVEFHKNLTYRELVELLGRAVAGIHSMTDEHFGISVVEYMAAGAIPIAHNSGGPRMDIVLEEDGQKTGFLAQSAEEFAIAIATVLKMPKEERLAMAAAARRRASGFSEQRFYDSFKAAICPFF